MHQHTFCNDTVGWYRPLLYPKHSPQRLEETPRVVSISGAGCLNSLPFAPGLLHQHHITQPFTSGSQVGAPTFFLMQVVALSADRSCCVQVFHHFVWVCDVMSCRAFASRCQHILFPGLSTSVHRNTNVCLLHEMRCDEMLSPASCPSWQQHCCPLPGVSPSFWPNARASAQCAPDLPWGITHDDGSCVLRSCKGCASSPVHFVQQKGVGGVSC